MEKKLLLVCILFILSRLALGVNDSTAQERGVRDRLVLTAGAGINVLGTTLQLKYEESTYWRSRSATIAGRSTPVFLVAADYGFSPRISAGLSIGYQSATVDVSDNYYLSAGQPIVYADSWKRLHFAVRGDYSFFIQEHLQLYTGLKIGYNVYTMTSERAVVDSLYTSELNVMPYALSTQVHLGCNYYFNSVVGLNFEFGLGIGGPYLAECGIVVKI